jgi:hypothetical protein
MAQYAWIIALLGNVITIVGAVCTARAVILTPAQARALAQPRWNVNEDLKAALLAQSKAAQYGLWAVGIGTGLQIARDVVEKFWP